jgi:hypothetical protein
MPVFVQLQDLLVQLQGVHAADVNELQAPAAGLQMPWGLDKRTAFHRFLCRKSIHLALLQPGQPGCCSGCWALKIRLQPAQLAQAGQHPRLQLVNHAVKQNEAGEPLQRCQRLQGHANAEFPRRARPSWPYCGC